jgi:hypothetical protein
MIRSILKSVVFNFASSSSSIAQSLHRAEHIESLYFCSTAVVKQELLCFLSPSVLGTVSLIIFSKLSGRLWEIRLDELDAWSALWCYMDSWFAYLPWLHIKTVAATSESLNTFFVCRACHVPLKLLFGISGPSIFTIFLNSSNGYEAASYPMLSMRRRSTHKKGPSSGSSSLAFCQNRRGYTHAAMAGSVRPRGWCSGCV